MIKRLAVMLLMLLLTIVVLVGYQWFVYEINYKQLEMVQNKPLDTEITMTHTNTSIVIDQKVSNLMQANFRIKLPQNSSEVQCKFANGDPCTISNEETIQMVNVHSNLTVFFSYSIPIDETQKTMWIEDWFVRFITGGNEVIPMNFEVMLSEKDKSINWIAGADLRGQVDKEHLVYFAWSKSESNSFPLYMTETELCKYKELEPKLSIYSSEQLDDDIGRSYSWVQKLVDLKGLTIIKSEENNIYQSPHLIVVPSHTDSKVIEELIVATYIKNLKYPYSNNMDWIWNVLSAVILNRPVGNDKVYEMSAELLENLPPEINSSFSQWLLEENTRAININIADLDYQLTQGNMSTQFFSENININDPVVPFHYLDHRSVYHNDVIINNEWIPIVRNQELYFPLVMTMENLGFKITVITEEKLFLIYKDGNSWRLYLDKPYYIYNQEGYGLISKPLEQLGDGIFISEKWLEQLLKVEVVKRENNIYLF